MPSQKNTTLVMGIDGGGSKTVALLVDESGDILVEESAGPTNLHIVGVVSTARTILRLLTKCCSKAGYTTDKVSVIVMGLSGAGRLSDQQRITENIKKIARSRKLKLNTLIVESDARIALEGALRGNPGIIIIGGTGTIVFGKDPDGTIHRVGGWGRILGDEGGGYFLGREAISAVLRQFDGRGEPTSLADILAKKYKLDSPEAIIAAVYTDEFDIASLAPEVIDAARDGDRVAERVLQHGAAEIEEHVRVLSSKLSSTQKIRTVMLGGLFSGDNIYSKMVRDKISGSLPHVQIQPAMASAAYGAVLMAQSVIRTL